MKKTLAIVLSILALLSVMTLVAYSINSAEAQQYAGPTVLTDTTVPTQTETEPGFADKFTEFWQRFYPIFDAVYKNGFVVLTQFLSWIVNIILGSVFA